MDTSAIITLFQKYLQEEITQRKMRLPYACCLSTVGLDGFPNARFVSLKEIRDEKFIISGTLSSRKGREIEADNRVALTFWWAETQRQVRIQGRAVLMEEVVVNDYFNERNLESRIVSSVCRQGEVLHDIEELTAQYDAFVQNLNEDQTITKPENWGAYAIDPLRIEFLTFSNNRFHNRRVFEKETVYWMEYQLQP